MRRVAGTFKSPELLELRWPKTLPPGQSTLQYKSSVVKKYFPLVSGQLRASAS